MQHCHFLKTIIVKVNSKLIQTVSTPAGVYQTKGI